MLQKQSTTIYFSLNDGNIHNYNDVCDELEGFFLIVQSGVIPLKDKQIFFSFYITLS